MRILVFGLSISSAWGNGHATLLRGLFRALYAQGHEIEFLERDTSYYAAHRDAPSLPYVNIRLYSDWNNSLPLIKGLLADSDVCVVTSYCPDGAAACELALNADDTRSVFYDLDTPVTLSQLAKGETPPYLPAQGLAGFDLVLSYTGGEALNQLRSRLGARTVASLYGWVDPESHSRVPACPEFSSDLSYLGTYAVDRQRSLEELLITPACELSKYRFVIAGAMFPKPEEWPSNVRYFSHISPPQHSSFYSSSPLTLSVTRGTMAALGYCPSGRLFEASACGTAVLSDWWEGLDQFFTPGEEILIARSTSEAVTALTADRGLLVQVGARARERTLDCHTAAHRAQRFINLIERSPDTGGQLKEPVNGLLGLPRARAGASLSAAKT